MSNILKAIQKSSRGRDDIGERLQQIDQVGVFPPPHHSQIAEFDRLVNTLIGLHGGGLGEVVVFSAASRGEGCSFVSYNVARQLTALMNRPVAWVDGNFMHPQQGLPGQDHSFRNMLAEPELVAALPAGDGLNVIPNGQLRIKPTDLLKSRSYERVLDAMREKFYFTVIDAPPFLDSVDVAHLAARTTGLVVVVESRGLKHEVIRNGLDGLTRHGVPVLGAVLNRRVFDIPQAIYKRL
jgi:Mrp family chromosome partitioning ATPase